MPLSSDLLVHWQARAKADAVVEQIGYPAWVLNDTALTAMYAQFNVSQVGQPWSVSTRPVGGVCML